MPAKTEAPPQTPASEPGEPPADVREAVLKALKDPDSAKFTDVFLVRHDDMKTAACGSINSRNS